jgi:hypothetical protein
MYNNYSTMEAMVIIVCFVFCCSFLVSSLLFNLSAINGRIRLHVLFRHGDFVAISIF